MASQTRRRLLALLLPSSMLNAHARELPTFDAAAQQYRAGRFSDAYGKFMALADTGDPDAAHIALFMNRYGPQLYESYWDATPDEIAFWASLIRDRAGRPQPVFVPDAYGPDAGGKSANAPKTIRHAQARQRSLHGDAAVTTK